MTRRRFTAIALLVSFVAMATSGLLMLIIDKPSFTFRMHPVHKLFGLVLVGAALSHIPLNARASQPIRGNAAPPSRAPCRWPPWCRLMTSWR